MVVGVVNDLVEELAELLVRYLEQLFKRRQVRLTVVTADIAMQERISLATGRSHWRRPTEHRMRTVTWRRRQTGRCMTDAHIPWARKTINA